MDETQAQALTVLTDKSTFIVGYKDLTSKIGSDERACVERPPEATRPCGDHTALMHILGANFRADPRAVELWP